MKIFLLILVCLAFTSRAPASTANYFRAWEGFKKSDMSPEQLNMVLPPFMQSTVTVYKQKLNSYFVAIPPAKKPAYVPDEFALIALVSEAAYQTVRATPEGKAYGESHWTIFDKDKSKSAEQKPSSSPQLESKTVYDFSPKPLDWQTGHTTFFVGTRKANITAADFLVHLRKHIELTRKSLENKGLLRGYVVVVNENYEAAYLNWKSQAEMDKAFAGDAGKAVGTDAGTFMDMLMFEGSQKFRGVPENAKAIGSGFYQVK